MYFDPKSFPKKMKRVFDLAKEINENRDYVNAVQAMSLNSDKPFLGLKGNFGLYGSKEWWENIRNGNLKINRIIGNIQNLIFAGQDSRWGHEINSFTLRLENGKTIMESIYAHESDDWKLFQIGSTVAVSYILDEFKPKPKSNSAVNYSEIVLEMMISV